MKRSSWASGSSKVPACSTGFWVAITKNGVGTIIFAFYFSLPFIAIYFFNLKYLFNPPAEDPLDIATAHLDGWTDEDEIVDGYEDWADYGYDDADHDHVATSHS